MKKYSNSSGNVLFLILIAVALFAALSYAVTNSSKGGGSSISKDKAKLIASEIVQYAVSVEQAVARMQVISKVPEYGFDFSFSGFSGSAANTTCTNDECKLFHSAGGSIPGKLLPKDAWHQTNTTMQNTWQGKVYFAVVNVQDVGSDLPDLVMYYPGVDPSICVALDNLLKISLDGTGDAPFDHPGAGTVNYSGNLTSFPTVPPGTVLGDTASAIVGERTFCVDFSNSNSNYFFYHVLLAR